MDKRLNSHRRTRKVWASHWSLISTIKVCNCSKLKVDQLSTFLLGVLILLTKHSQKPPYQGALSTMKFQETL